MFSSYSPIFMQKKDPVTTKPDADLLEVPEVEEEEDTPWKLILYDDDVHTFDEVITQLIKALNCGVPKAEELTWKVHNEGKAVVYEGTFEDCLKINSVLQEIELNTEIKG